MLKTPVSMTKISPHLSVVSPVYGCATILPALCAELAESLAAIDEEYEIIFVNDASPDGAWEVIQQLAEADPRIRGVDLSRNFGQHAAIRAGLALARGDWVVVMDCDLQDQPAEISKLYAKAMEGYEVVFGRRESRQDSSAKVLSARLYRKIQDYFTDSNSDPAVANFGIYQHKVIEAFNGMREQTRTLQLTIRWLGFHATSINIEHAPRREGRSSYNFRRLLSMGLNIIVSESNKPLKLSISFGFFMAMISLLYALYLVARYFILGVTVAGWTSVIVSIYFVGGLLFANLGILGLYLGKVFDETKARPIYVVREVTWDYNRGLAGESDDGSS
ncbi:MAG: glycosyltransferase family 2 protein [gamma proteobacterium endosymbiont of Lamellibrachia anaximandri]|nr:glycosyltransferase family 2 protein [gamma proteobacterium endosymbiont of Lamellibrachia anaximandri]MBL3617355.1 glycosyltransferase family 2 protein [gamma proteobacterium endosymbiont of Lamellibrachia anaximandri]